MTSLKTIGTPSPNFDERTLPISMVVLHYTGMEDGPSAINWLANPASKVSSHYVVEEDGQLIAMVDEEKRAWHAGRAFWRGITNVNSASIGIEIVNPGHEFGYRPFPETQMQTVTDLVADIVQRHHIKPINVVGHSDVAPERKEDPGELFDWDRLARLKLAVPKPNTRLVDPYWSDGAFLLALERFGYSIADGPAAVRAFQRRFRQDNVDGIIDGECRALLFALLIEEY
ncbi:MAG: N-acetylmuramoyl-L-alanine amidase [Pseudomonadota bacterium]